MTKAPSRRSRSVRTIEIVIESPEWKIIPSVKPTLRRALDAAWPKDLDDAEVAIMLTDDHSIRALNHRWRGRDEPTNVLAFPGHPAGQEGGAPRMLGDIVVAYGVSAREAAAEGKSLLHHVTHLAVHGFLHLLGYNHESYAEAEIMESLERSILARLDVPDPFSTREVDVAS